jgi:hypothetical protein
MQSAGREIAVLLVGYILSMALLCLVVAAALTA